MKDKQLRLLQLLNKQGYIYYGLWKDVIYTQWVYLLFERYGDSFIEVPILSDCTESVIDSLIQQVLSEEHWSQEFNKLTPKCPHFYLINVSICDNCKRNEHSN